MGMIIQRIRDSAKDERCTSCEQDDTSTVVFAHGPRMGTAGMGQKVDDWWGAYLCHSCHMSLDLHWYNYPDELVMWMKAIHRTWGRFIEKGLIALPEAPKPRQAPSKKIVPHSGRMRR